MFATQVATQLTSFITMPKAIELQHDEMLDELTKLSTIEDKFSFLHTVMRKRYDFIHRVGVAALDPKANCLKTFARIVDGDNQLPKYQYALNESQSLHRTISDGRKKIINDRLLLDSRDENSQRLQEHDFRSSYMIPTYQNAMLAGFVFFDSCVPDVFRKDIQLYLDAMARQLSQLVSPEQSLP